MKGERRRLGSVKLISNNDVWENKSCYGQTRLMNSDENFFCVYSINFDLGIFEGSLSIAMTIILKKNRVSTVTDRLILHHNLTKASFLLIQKVAFDLAVEEQTVGVITFSRLLHSFHHMFSGRAEYSSHAMN